MKIASWNVNSVRVRIGQVCQWIEATTPDLLLLQEIKCEDAAFPAMEFRALGYTPYVFGQKSYNGVAILSRLPGSDITTGLAGDPADLQARFDLAKALHAGGDVEGAVAELLELFRRNREWNDGAAKAQLFTIFDSLKATDPVVLNGRRKLSSLIFA